MCVCARCSSPTAPTSTPAIRCSRWRQSREAIGSGFDERNDLPRDVAMSFAYSVRGEVASIEREDLLSPQTLARHYERCVREVHRMIFVDHDQFESARQ